MEDREWEEFEDSITYHFMIARVVFIVVILGAVAFFSLVW